MPEIQFALVNVGQRFFDPVSGEEFEKISATSAHMLAEEFVDDFGADELVVVYEE